MYGYVIARHGTGRTLESASARHTFLREETCYAMRVGTGFSSNGTVSGRVLLDSIIGD
jgi:hypothetical protein